MNYKILNFFAETSASFDKSKVLKNVDTSSKNVASSSNLAVAFNNVFFWAGIICVAMVIASGFMYIISTGNSSRMTKAKNGLVYSVIGLVVVMLSSVIVNIILERIG